MKAEEKIHKVLERIKGKAEIAPPGEVLDYRAGFEITSLNSEDDIMILNKLANEGIIEVVSNSDSEY